MTQYAMVIDLLRCLCPGLQNREQHRLEKKRADLQLGGFRP